MDRPRKTFGTLTFGTLIVGGSVVLLSRLMLLYDGSNTGPGSSRIVWEAKAAALIRGVVTGDPANRVTAIRSLGEAMRESASLDEGRSYGLALDALRGALQDRDASVVVAAADTLGGLWVSNRRVTADLAASLKIDDSDVRLAAARALLRIGGEERETALRVLTDMAADTELVPDRKALIEAMQLAGDAGQDAAIRVLARLLAHEEHAVRVDAASCVPILGSGAPRMLLALEPLLDSVDPDLRYTTALAAIQAFDIESNPDPRLVEILSGAISDPSRSPAERRNALTALYSFGLEGDGAVGMGPVTFPAGSAKPLALRRCGLELARQLEHKDVDVRLAAATLLQMIDPKSLAGEEGAAEIAKP